MCRIRYAWRGHITTQNSIRHSHWGERQIIAHWLEQGVVHCFEFVDDLPAVAKVATRVFVDGASTSDGEASPT